MRGSSSFLIATLALLLVACGEADGPIEDGGTSADGAGPATVVPPECVADELDGTTRAEPVFSVEEGMAASVEVTFRDAQLVELDGMACTPHPLPVPAEYPGCNQGWDCGGCFCQITVPGFGENLWSVKCSNFESDACARYQFVEYKLKPYVEAPIVGGGGGDDSCGSCMGCYDDCNTSCDGYPGSCSTTCFASCDRCCTR